MPDNLPDDNISIGGNAVGNGNSQTTPVSSGVPGSGEVLPLPNSVETISSITPEVQKNMEKVSVPSAPEENTVAVPSIQPEPAPAPQTTPQNVVDEREGDAQKVKHIETTHSLTAEADEDEEDFIEQTKESHTKG